MQVKLRNALGAVMFVSTAKATAQGSAPAGGATTTGVASAPGTDATVPGDPTWLIVGVAFVIGVIVGYAIAKISGRQGLGQR